MINKTKILTHHSFYAFTLFYPEKSLPSLAINLMMADKTKEGISINDTRQTQSYDNILLILL